MKSLKFDNISFGYNPKKPIFQNLSFEIKNPLTDKGYVSALMGASGSGKSTLLKLILGTEKPQQGKIICVPETPVIAYVPQEPILYEHLTPLQNARYFATTNFYKKRFDEKLFEELATSLNIIDVLRNSKSVLDLSGGQKQRINLLRALSIRPDFLFLDEPTTGLDAEVKLQFLYKLREIVVQQNLLVVYVTHHKLETELVVDEITYIAKDTTTNSIQRVFQNNLLDFIQCPPLLEAVRVFDYPKPNLLKCKMHNNSLVVAHVSDKSEDCCYLDIDPHKIVFTDTGWQTKIIAQNPIFTLIEVENSGQYLSLDTPAYNIIKTTFSLNGNFNCYMLNGTFLEVFNAKIN